MRRLVVAVFLACVALSGAARADEVVFTNGDRLQGTIVSMTEGKLEIASDVAGAITVPMARVETFWTHETVALHFDDGTVVNQVIDPGEAGTVSTAPEGTLQPQALPLTRLVSINPPPEPLPEWEGSVMAGLTVERGNTDLQDGYAELKGMRQSKNDRIKFDATYRGKREKDEDTGDASTSKRYYGAGLKYDYFWSQRWFTYASSRAEKDATADLDLRFTGGAGLGYNWINTETTDVDLEAGVAWISENFSDASGDTDNDYVSGRLGWKLDRKFGAQVKFFHYGEWFPSLEDGKDHLVRTQTGLRSDLTARFFVEGKTIWQWDSTPAEDKERVDVSYIFGLGLGF